MFAEMRFGLPPGTQLGAAYLLGVSLSLKVISIPELMSLQAAET